LTDPGAWERVIAEQLAESAQVKERVTRDANLLKVIAAVAGELVGCYSKGKKTIFFGNGGSAADAQHLATELVSRFKKDRKKLPSLALTTNTSTLTAIGNDYGYEKVFSQQIEAYANPGDVVVGISTSGNSPNVLEALVVARRMGCITVGMTGNSGGKVRGQVDYLIAVPSDDTPRIQESHIAIGHILCGIVEEALFGSTSTV